MRFEEEDDREAAAAGLFLLRPGWCRREELGPAESSDSSSCSLSRTCLEMLTVNWEDDGLGPRLFPLLLPQVVLMLATLLPDEVMREELA